MDMNHCFLEFHPVRLTIKWQIRSFFMYENKHYITIAKLSLPHLVVSNQSRYLKSSEKVEYLNAIEKSRIIVHA